MLIQIESGKAKDARKVRIEMDDGAVVEFSAPSLAEAHAMIAKGRAEGWDSVLPPEKKGE